MAAAEPICALLAAIIVTLPALSCCEILNVHIVPHTHDDVGWLKTVDQYYSGTNRSIDGAGVKFILDSVVQELQKDSRRTFIYVEMAFFTRWWKEQDSATREAVKQLVSDRRLEFVNAGWSMNDEGATHYNAIIDQMSQGLRFVSDTFGPEFKPNVAWHIDTFGHSSEQASLFARMGFDAVFFARIDYQDREKREKEQRMEMIWRGSPKNLKEQSDIFAGVLYYMYNPPPEMCFDSLRCTDDAVVTNPDLFTFNLDYKVEKFINDTLLQARSYRTNNVMLTMGSDFQWEDAATWYKNLDILIDTINQRYPNRFKLFYSTPRAYLEAVHAANLTWELKTDDFMPYGIHPFAYFSGYFTSRPALKYYVRNMNGFLQTCRQWEVLAGGPPSNASSERLAEAMAVAQHHDAVSGTERQHVANDYALRLYIGQKECQSAINLLLNRVVPKTSSPSLHFEYCDSLNMSACSLGYTNLFDLVVYNPLPRTNKVTLSVPVSVPVELRDSAGSFVPQCEVKLIYQSSIQSPKYSSYPEPLPLVLTFQTTLPPLGFATFFVRQSKSANCKYLEPQTEPKDIVIRNEFVEVAFDNASGRIKSITNLALKQTLQIDQQFFWYNASAGNNVNSSQASGPYVFRPNSSHPFPVNNNSNKAEVVLINGTVHQSVSQVYSDMARQAVHLYKGANYVELEFMIGPIPVADGLGKEVISRFDTDLASQGVWYTDANGREMQKRTRNHRQTWTLNNTDPVASNFYPVNSRMYIQDVAKGLQFTVLTDRSQSGASLMDGSVELMLHRRLLYDDHRGVVEPLNEPGQDGKGLFIFGKHWIVFDSINKSAKTHRHLGENVLLRPMMAFHRASDTVDKYRSAYYTVNSSLNRGLPSNVRLLTLQFLKQDTILLRLEHQFEVDEDAELSKPATVDLDGLFTPFKIVSVRELSLGGDSPLGSVKRMSWRVFEDQQSDSVRSHRGKPSAWSYEAVDEKSGLYSQSTAVTLSPMEIRTFMLTVSYIQ